MKIAVVPGTLALEEKYASLTDPIPELRSAVTAAREWADEVYVINGSARRTQASPGPFDERAVPFDEALFHALRAADGNVLLGLDQSLARELWATTAAAPDLARALSERQAWEVAVAYEGSPTGVAWWVIRYEALR